MTDWTSLRYAVVDIEGNGQQPPELVELAVVPIIEGAVGDPATWLVRPKQPIKYFATRVHGITKADVADSSLFEEIAGEVSQALDVPAVVAHNAHVDTSVLKRYLPNWDVPETFDTLKLARRLLPGQPSYQLGMLVGAFNLDKGLPESLAPHRAAYDALVTARLFVHLATNSGNQPMTLEALRSDAPSRASRSSSEASPLF